MAGKMNPRIRKVEIGVRELSTISIYPLSIKDQTHMVELFVSIVEKFFGEVREKQITNSEFFSIIAQLVMDNIPEFLKYVTDDELDLGNFTNYQLSEIAKHIYVDNFEDPGKNVQSLLIGLKATLFPSLGQ